MSDEVTMELENLEVLLLHKHTNYMKKCCDLINEEWPRSETARMMSLQASSDVLPTSLILVNDRKRILGHCKLTSIPSLPESCFVETVVINKEMRGKKLGSYLMTKAEEYCKNVLNLKMIHLSTKGQEYFYAKLGYEVCAPVSIYGTSISSKFDSTLPSIKVENSVPVACNTQAGPPPPPPPPMPMPTIINSNSTIKTNKTFMFKYI